MCFHSLPIAWLKKLAKHFFVDLQGEVTLWGICKVLVAECYELGDDEEKLLSILAKRVVGDKADATALDDVLDPKTMVDGIDPGDLQTFD